MVVLCMRANANSAGLAEASQGPGTSAWVFPEGRPSLNVLRVLQPPGLLLLVRANWRAGNKVINQEHRRVECDTVW